MIHIINYKEGYQKHNFLENITEYVEEILREFHKSHFDLNIVLCGNSFIQSLNRKYRGKDYATDVLSFSQAQDGEEEFFDLLEDLERDEEDDQPLGDIIVSIDKVIEQAKEFQVTEEEELARLILHGVLHLLGFDHEKSKEEEKQMFEKEDFYITGFFKKYAH
jgi:probable rRNA maturation factor